MAVAAVDAVVADVMLVRELHGLLSIVAAPEGVKHLESMIPDVQVYTAALDRALNERKYILPGLGDFGDRLYGT